MGLDGLDASLMNRFWATGDLSRVQSDYDAARLENAGEGAVVEAQGAQPAVEVEISETDEGMARLSQNAGNERYHDVFGRAKVLGQRADESARTNVTAGMLELNFDRLANDLATMSLRRTPAPEHETDEARTQRETNEKTLAKTVLTALLSSDEVRARAQENRPLSRAGVLALLNAGLGSLEMIHKGQATADSIFELVRGDVYDITQPADVLKLSVRMAQKARETFIDADGVRVFVADAQEKIQAQKGLSEDVKNHLIKRLESAGERVIAERAALVKSLDVEFSLGDGSPEVLEGKIKDVREKLRAFRYDIDRLDGVKMGFMESLRRRLDNVGRKEQVLTRASFNTAVDAEASLNFMLRSVGLLNEKGKPLTLPTVLDSAHLAATTHLTHLANNRIRYYFSGKEQKIEGFRQKAHEVLDKMMKAGSSRELQFEVGADAKFKADVGIAKADIKAGGKYLYTAKVTVDKGGEVTLVVTHGGQAFAEGSAKLGLNDGDKADTWDANARDGHEVLGGSVGVKGSVGLSRSRTIKYRSIEDFIASLGGESSLLTRTPIGTMACLGKIGGFFRMVGHGLTNLVTAAGFRIHKSREDNAAYTAQMRELGVMSSLDMLIAHRENAIRTVNGTSWNFGGSAGAKGSLNIGDFRGTEEFENPETHKEEEHVNKGVLFGAGASATVSYDRTFARTATTYRTHLDTARKHTQDWLKLRVGAWYDAVAGASDTTKGDGAAALRDLMDHLQSAEDDLARVPEKTEKDWQAFADKLGVLSLQLAYIEKLHPDIDTSALAERLINPHVEIPADIYDELMQDVAGVAHSGSHKTTVEFSVDWSLGSRWFDDIGDGLTDLANEGIGGDTEVLWRKTAAKESSALLSGSASGAAGTLLPFEGTIKGSYTYTTPVAKNSPCAWDNAAQHEWTIALAPNLTTRALVEILARKYVDTLSDVPPPKKKAVFKAAWEDFKSTLEESLGIASLKNAWNLTMSELAHVAPKIASLLNAPLSGAGTGLEVGVDTDYYKRMTFTVSGGHLTAITVDDLTKVGSSIGFRVGKMDLNAGIHMKETLTTIDGDRNVLVRPSIDGLMSKGEAFQRMGDFEGFKKLLADNAPGTLRLWRAATQHPHEAENDNAAFEETMKGVQNRKKEAERILDRVCNYGNKDEIDRANVLASRLQAAWGQMIGTPDDDGHRAEQVDAMAEFAWVMTECFTLARELGVCTRDRQGALVMTEPFPQHELSHLSAMEASAKPATSAPSQQVPPQRPPVSNTELARTILNAPRAELKDNAGGGSCFFYSAIQQINDPRYPETRLGADALRADLIRHMRDLDRSFQTPTPPQGLRHIGDHYYVNTNRGEEIVTDGVNLARTAAFRDHASNADVSHGAFLADLLQRPVTIITAEHESAITFDRDLRTNQPLQGEPIVIFYNRGQSGEGGHFRTVEINPPQA